MKGENKDQTKMLNTHSIKKKEVQILKILSRLSKSWFTVICFKHFTVLSKLLK